MALPSRVYVGFTVFGLMGSIAILAYAILLLAGYEAPPQTGLSSVFPDEREIHTGDVLFLVLAGAFCATFTVLSWRSLVAAARRDQLRRQA